jgi:methionyl aminopeptidase
MDWQERFSRIKNALFGKIMIIGKSKKELEKMRVAGELVAQAREELRRLVQPGITTMELNNAADKMIRDGGGYPTFLGYLKFPYSICASVNEQVVHGFPSDYALKEGDIISIDVGATVNGFVGDTALTAAVGKIDDEIAKLIEVTDESLMRAVEQCRAGKHIGDIGWAVQSYAESFGYGIVKDFVGHGIGRRMHEAPQIPNYGKPGTREKIRVGYVFAVEPMITLGKPETRILEDGWTVVTIDGKVSAHSEHTIAITEDGPEILTLTPEQKAQKKESLLTATV